MDIYQMRYVIGRAYPGESWKKKVANMPADQVVAIYYKFAAEKRLDNLDRPMPKQMTMEEIAPDPWLFEGGNDVNQYEQLSFEGIFT